MSKIVDRAGNPVPGDEGQDRLLEWMYGTSAGRLLVRVMIRPWVSKLAGLLLDSRLSSVAVAGFAKRHAIDLSEYEQRRFRSFNDFFTRRILPGKRPVDMAPDSLIAPCDSKLSVYSIAEDLRVTVKGTEYTLESLLRDEVLAEKYRGGYLLLFRLTVGDYHRYSYIDGGVPSAEKQITGVFHTVNPAAAGRCPIYKENTRVYMLLDTGHFGRVLQMEVGAALVGRIVNLPLKSHVCRGEEKGKFEFGGSTVIVLLPADSAEIDEDILKNTEQNLETMVKLGEKIGNALKL